MKIGDYIYFVDKNMIEKFEIKEIMLYKYIAADTRINEDGIWLNMEPGKYDETQVLIGENIHYGIENNKKEFRVFDYKLNTYNEISSHGWYSTVELANERFLLLNKKEK